MDNQKKKKQIRSKDILFFIGIVVIAAVGGYIIGRLTITNNVLSTYWNQHIKDNNKFLELIKIYGLLLLFILTFYLHVLIHEFGHLITGIMTGYEFVSYRIGHVVWCKVAGKVVRRKYSIPGTAGQCIMMPKAKDYKNISYILYNLGGVLLNLLISIVSIILATCIKAIPFPVDITLIFIGISGIILALFNGIPMKVSGMANDGYNIIAISKDDMAKKGFFIQLKSYGLLTQGKRLKDLPGKWFSISKNSDVTNPLITSIKFLEYCRCLDNFDLDGGKEILDDLDKKKNQLIGIYQLELSVYQLLHELLGAADDAMIKKLYTPRVKNYLNQCKYMPEKVCIQALYTYLVEKDVEKALNLIHREKELIENNPVLGEREMQEYLCKLAEGKCTVEE